MLTRTSSKQEAGGNQQEANPFSFLQPCGHSCPPPCALCWQSLTAQAKGGLQSPGPSITKTTIEEGSFQAESQYWHTLLFASPFPSSLLLSPSPILYGLWEKKQTSKYASENLSVLKLINSFLNLCFKSSERKGREISPQWR